MQLLMSVTLSHSKKREEIPGVRKQKSQGIVREWEHKLGERLARRPALGKNEPIGGSEQRIEENSTQKTTAHDVGETSRLGG